MVRCKNCPIILSGKDQKVFCSRKCGSIFYNKNKHIVICPHCDKKLQTRWNSHIEKCKNANAHTYSLICEFGCNRPAKHFFKNGKSCCSSGTGGCIGHGSRLNRSHVGHTAWNKGLTKETNDVIKRVSENQLGISHPHSQETKDALSIIAKKRGLGGYVRGSGRGKKGWYKGIFCDSSWELAFVIYNLDHNIKIARCEELRYYEWENQQRKYKPDFMINDQIYEIKGYKTEQWIAKEKANPDIIVLYESEIKPYIKYVVDKYGKNYINMYE